MFTVMALFACAWGLLLPYYNDQKIPASAELFAAYSGFLFVYVGGLLMLQAQSDLKNEDHEKIVPWQIIGLWLLIIIAVPSLPSIPMPDKPIPLFKTRDQVYLVFGTILDIVGFIAIAVGVRNLLGEKAYATIGVVLLGYSALDIGYTYWGFCRGPERVMPDVFAYGFAAAKIVFTLVFGCLIAHYGMPQATRERGSSYWVRRYFGLV